MEEILYKFLQDVSQGVYGDSSLSYNHIYRFFKLASTQDLEDLQEYYWDYTSSLTNDDDLDPSEIEEFINEIITAHNN